MELSTRLTDALARLAVDTDDAAGTAEDGTALVDGLTGLVSSLTDAVTGFAGLRLTLVHTAHAVHLTAPGTRPADPAVGSSLRLALPAVSATFEEGGRLVVWSTAPGALVDLGADLAHVLAARRPADGTAAVQLDVDLPVPALRPGLVGLEELATLHRAAGFLIGQGHDPGAVHQVLRDRAARDGVSTVVWADRLLRTGRAPRTPR